MKRKSISLFRHGRVNHTAAEEFKAGIAARNTAIIAGAMVKQAAHDAVAVTDDALRFSQDVCALSRSMLSLLEGLVTEIRAGRSIPAEAVQQIELPVWRGRVDSLEGQIRLLRERSTR